MSKDKKTLKVGAMTRNTRDQDADSENLSDTSSVISDASTLAYLRKQTNGVATSLYVTHDAGYGKERGIQAGG